MSRLVNKTLNSKSQYTTEGYKIQRIKGSLWTGEIGESDMKIPNFIE